MKEGRSLGVRSQKSEVAGGKCDGGTSAGLESIASQVEFFIATH
jgi:hypothetical protein